MRCGDTRDAEPILDWLCTDRFPRLGTPSLEEGDRRQLRVHRLKRVRRRTAVKNPLHAWAMSQGVCRRPKRWTAKGRAELEGLALLPWASRRRQERLEMLDQVAAAIEALDRAVEEEAQAREEAVRLMTPPGVGPVVSRALVLTLGPVTRFANSRQVVPRVARRKFVYVETPFLECGSLLPLSAASLLTGEGPKIGRPATWP